MHLDTRTIVILATFVAIAPTLISVSVWYTKQTCPGFGRWTLGTLLGTLAMIFLSLRGVAPDWISMVLSNTMAVSAAILYFQGVREFCGLRLYGWPEYLAGSLTVSAVIYFKYFDNNIDFRILALSLLLGSLGFVNGITLLRTAPAGRGFSTLFTGIVFILVGVCSSLSRRLSLCLYARDGPLCSFGGERVLFCGYFARRGLLVLWFYPHAWRSSK